MLWLLILLIAPMNAYASGDDDLVIGVGFVILTAAITAGRARRYLKTMNSKIESILSVKQQVAGLVTAGGLTLTATNVISLIGMCLTCFGLVFIYLNWRQGKRTIIEVSRRNDIAADANKIAAEKLEFEKSQASKSKK